MTVFLRQTDPLPQMLDGPLARLADHFHHLPDAPFPPVENSPQAFDPAAVERVLGQVADRLADNFPYFHPLYAGQMLKPPHPVARAAYAMAMAINPNNHARDGGRASSAMEIEAVAEIAAMFGLSHHLGHLTSGGTFANLEALWIAGKLAPGRRILASEQAHYTHSRISSVLQLPFASVACDPAGRMDISALEDQLRLGDVGTVVATLGTTAIGAVDPLPDILALQSRYGFRIHVDAAYGGYFRLIQDHLDPAASAAFALIPQADSIVVDPHKHGLQPYGCGCVLFRDPSIGRFYRHDSPYTYFTSADLHLGEISLECSRAGAAAVALWATQRLMPLVPGGAFAQSLAAGRRAALELDRRLRADQRFVPFAAHRPELDIVVWQVRADDPANSTRRAQQIFDDAAKANLHLALVQLPQRFFTSPASSGASSAQPLEQQTVTCLRSVLMKPEHEQWIDTIWQLLSSVSG